jgi:DNA-binding NarL/FixJ family response regulator
VDDDAAFREMVCVLLERAGLSTVEAGGGAEALDVVRDLEPTLVLLDVVLPDMNGYEVCHAIRAGYGEAVSVLFTSGERVEAVDRSTGLLIGGDEYVTKPFDPDELVARARRLATRRRGALPAQPTNGHQLGLTAREREVLALLVQGLRMREIASELVISPKTVASHVQRILAKLQVDSPAHAVLAAYRHGLVEPEPQLAAFPA